MFFFFFCQVLTILYQNDCSTRKTALSSLLKQNTGTHTTLLTSLPHSLSVYACVRFVEAFNSVVHVAAKSCFA